METIYLSDLKPKLETQTRKKKIPCQKNVNFINDDINEWMFLSH